ncbi:MAG: hypothetical protein JWP35_112 [Caulobacter sp.]|nr:hypothetical protein [Caulobacter sp.]
MAESDFDAADPQDRAETLDETHLTEDGEDLANFDDIVDVFDATTRRGDNDVEGLEDEEDEGDFDDDEAELIALNDDERDDEGTDSESDSLASGDDNNEVSDVADETRTFESEDLSDKEKQALPFDDERKPPEHDPHTEKQLDHGLKETFPASDPVSINPGAD